MNSTSPSFSDQLEKFSEAQLAEVSIHDIQASTVHLILTTVFFTGATIGIAKQSNTPKKIYLSILGTFLENRFGLNSERASGMIESNARLYKRYVLIEKIYNAGWKAARSRNQQTDKKSDELKTLLKKYQDLIMSALSLEGTKEQVVAAPVEVEKIVITASQPVVEETPTRWKRKALIITLLALIGGATYAALFTTLFSTLEPVLKSTLESIQEQLSKLPLEEWLDKVLSLIP
ncbi:MAG: hypothetical protein QNK31_11620 [Porticoccus sp.]|nr:hypothetical protein [Porticoccus sp.]